MRGPKALRRYIEQQEMTVHGFAIHHRLNPSEISKLVRGVRQRVSVEQAAQIERATSGVVTWRMWLPR